jgi:uncharacterized protein YbjQ (UPF0145 family)
MPSEAALSADPDPIGSDGENPGWSAAPSAPKLSPLASSAFAAPGAAAASAPSTASPTAAASAPAAPAASASAALRASAILRRGSGTEAYPKSSLTMTDADAPAEAPGLLVTTGPNVEGRRIASYLGVVSVEIVIPKDVLFRNPAPYGELHRIKAAEEQLQRVKRKAFEELSEKARALGADAMVGATLQFSQFDAVVFLCAALGTAVQLEP